MMMMMMIGTIQFGDSVWTHGENMPASNKYLIT